jgi:hypothetical protein
MKTLSKLSIIALVIVFTLSMAGPASAATNTVDLGTTVNFSVLAGQHITNVPTSIITGDTGLSPASGSFYSGLTSSEVTGTIYAVDSAGPTNSVNNPSLLTTAKNDLTTAYTDASNRTPSTTFATTDNQLGGKTLTAGVYAFGHGDTANLTAASPLILDGQGDSGSVFIFQASSDLVTASNSVVELENGAQACNVFWQVTSSATLGTGSTFVGNILALTSITDTGSSNIQGRLLARNADVILNKTTITKATCSTPNNTNTNSNTTSNNTTTGLNSSLANTKLPNTGVNPNSNQQIPWKVVVPTAVLTTLFFVYIVRKNRIF